MTNRSKTDVWIVNSLTGGEKLLVDNSFHFYIMVEPFLCNVQVITSYLSTILMVPPLQTYSHLEPTQQGKLLLQTYSHLEPTQQGNLYTEQRKGTLWTYG